MTLYFIPLEPMDNRYTGQWWRWFKEVFDEEEIDWRMIPGDSSLVPTESSSTFLDFSRTFAYKASQMAELLKCIKRNDRVLFADGEFPGMEALEYWSKLNNQDIGIATIWHAGTYDPWDLTARAGLTRVGARFEEGWLDIADKVFLATEYHKGILTSSRLVPPAKCVITGLPVDVSGLRECYKGIKQTKGAVFTGRLSEEKGIGDVWRFEQLTGKMVFKTQGTKLTKHEYYCQLAMSSHVFAPSKQETFGYGVVEGMALGLRPIVPNGLSFTDYVPPMFRYSNLEEAAWMFTEDRPGPMWDIYKQVEKYQYQKVIKRMLKEIDSIG